jgi:hypothetical protein
VQPVKEPPRAVQPVTDTPRAVQPAAGDIATDTTDVDTKASAPPEQKSSAAPDDEPSPES